MPERSDPDDAGGPRDGGGTPADRPHTRAADGGVEYTYEIELEPQYRDLDPNGHVNQAVYASYFEQARATYWRDVVGIRHDESGLAVAHQEIDYERPIVLGETVTVRMAIDRLGTSSIPMRYEARVGDELAAEATVVLIAYDREAGESIPIPAAWRDPIEEREGLSDAEG